MNLVWGDELDDALRPVIGVTLVATAAGSATWSFMAIWAIEELDAKGKYLGSRLHPPGGLPDMLVKNAASLRRVFFDRERSKSLFTTHGSPGSKSRRSAMVPFASRPL